MGKSITTQQDTQVYPLKYTVPLLLTFTFSVAQVLWLQQRTRDKVAGDLFPLSLLRKELFAWEVNHNAKHGEVTPEKLVKAQAYPSLKLAFWEIIDFKKSNK